MKRMYFGCAISSLVVLAATASPAVAVSCGDEIAAGDRVTLSVEDPITSAECSSSPVLTILDGAKVDMAGFTIRCSSTAVDGIILDGTRSQLENGAVRGCKRGVVLKGTGGHNIADVVAASNSLAGFKIVAGSDRNKLRDCAATQTASGNGFEILSDGNKLQDSVAFGNDSNGFYISGNSNSFKEVVGNTNGESGMLFEPEPEDSSIKCSKSAFVNNGSGFTALGGVDSLVKGNRADQNSGEGFLLLGAVESKVSGNVAVGNDIGFLLASASQSAVTGNVATGNSQGVVAEDLDELVVKGNRCAANSTGISIGEGVANSVIKSNIVIGSEDDDIVDFFSNDCSASTNIYSRNTFGTFERNCNE